METTKTSENSIGNNAVKDQSENLPAPPPKKRGFCIFCLIFLFVIFFASFLRELSFYLPSENEKDIDLSSIDFPVDTDPVPAYVPKTDFKEGVLEPYDTKGEVDKVLASFKIKLKYIDDNGKSKAVSEEGKKDYLLTESIIAFVLDQYFKNTIVKGNLNTIEICDTCKGWSDITRFKVPRVKVKNDYYFSLAIHEAAHTLALAKTNDQFSSICWKKGKSGYWKKEEATIISSCLRERDFISTKLTSYKYSTPVNANEYYSTSAFNEDLPESVNAYIVSPNEFRALTKGSPKLAQKYNYIKNYIFKGREF